MHAFGVEVDQVRTGTLKVAVHGTLDLAHTTRFDEALRRAERGASRCLLLDLRDVGFIDSRGLGLLLAARRRAARAGRRLVLVQVPDAVRRVFELTAHGEDFEMVDEVPEGLAG